MDINFELYKIFYHTANSGSFSEAARQLYISQSAVSQSIAGLEQKIGSRLFIRKSRKVTLTDEGEILFRHVEQAFNFIKAAEGKLSEMQTLGSGEIRIGVGDTNCRYFLTTFLEHFIKLHPKIKFKFVNRTSPQIMDILMNGQVDIGIVTLPAGALTRESSDSEEFANSRESSDSEEFANSRESADSGDSRYPIHTRNANIAMGTMDIVGFREVRDIFVASSRYSELKGRRIKLSELASQPLLLLQKDSSTRRNLDSFFLNSGLEVIPEIELESMELLVEFARIGLGVAHVLYESAENLIKSGELFEIETVEKMPIRKLGIATVKNVPLSHASYEFFCTLCQ